MTTIDEAIQQYKVCKYRDDCQLCNDIFDSVAKEARLAESLREVVTDLSERIRVMAGTDCEGCRKEIAKGLPCCGDCLQKMMDAGEIG